MKTVVAVLAAVLVVGTMAAAAQSSAAAPSGGEQDLRSLLHQFLAGASNNDRSTFDRFFADDVIYTRNSGQTTTKAAIMKGLPAKPAPSGSVYSADDVTVHEYGNVAVANFVLVAKDKDGKVNYYRDTGTFVRRKGQWQAIAWQATKISGADK